MIRAAYLCEFSSVNGGENSLLSFLQSAQPHVHPVFLCPGTGMLVDRLGAAGIERYDFCLVDDFGQRKSAQQVSAEPAQLILSNFLSMSLQHLCNLV